MSCFALRFAFFSFAVRGPFRTSEHLRGGMVDKQMKTEQNKSCVDAIPAGNPLSTPSDLRKRSWVHIHIWTSEICKQRKGNYEICAVLLTRAKAPHISAIEIMRGSTTMYSNVEYSDMARCECIAKQKNDNIHVLRAKNKCFQLQPSLSKHYCNSGLWMHVLKH